MSYPIPFSLIICFSSAGLSSSNCTSSVTTSICAGSEIIFPFSVSTINSNEVLDVYIRNRGAALNSFISNYNGKTFFGTNRWTITDESASGMFVWVTSDAFIGNNSNIIVRVRDNSIPNLYADLNFKINVIESNTFLYPENNIIQNPLSKNDALKYDDPVIGYYDGNINKIAVTGKSLSSIFAAGVQEQASNDWQTANYLGKMKNINIKGAAVSNIFVSRSKINIAKRKYFDFINNSVWVGGVRKTD